MSVEKQELGTLIFYCWIVAAEIIKIGYITTCECHGSGQPFNGWFFQAFQQSPYSLWWNYTAGQPPHQIVIHFLAGPYSLLWWFLNLPGHFGYYPFFGYLLICDIAIFALLARKSRWYALYFLTLTVWFTTYDPVDFWIVVFAVFGRYRVALLVLSPLTKLPIGSELWTGNLSVWIWTFTSHDSFSGSENWGRYLLLGSIWLFALAFHFPKVWGKIAMKIRGNASDEGPSEPFSDEQPELQGLESEEDNEGEVAEI